MSETKQDLLTVAIGDHDRSQLPSVMYVGLISSSGSSKKILFEKNQTEINLTFGGYFPFFLHLYNRYITVSPSSESPIREASGHKAPSFIITESERIRVFQG